MAITCDTELFLILTIIIRECNISLSVEPTGSKPGGKNVQKVKREPYCFKHIEKVRRMDGQIHLSLVCGKADIFLQINIKLKVKTVKQRVLVWFTQLDRCQTTCGNQMVDKSSL